MTPKEKAKELFDKFHFVNSESVELVTGDYELLFSLHESDAKECALIALDEILNVLNVIDNFEMIYWEQVKQEIEKL
tara:strand:- start:1842 stop:2072 length:231 start_codon:yes stop_codon:yes gene_type:complete